MDKIVVTIVDKQALFRVGVRHALSQQPDFEVFDSAPGKDQIALIKANSPDVLLLDIDYPSLRGLKPAQEIVLHCPITKVIILTYRPDDKQLFEIIKIEAVDYLDKSITGEELAKSIRQVARGDYPINDSVLTRPKVAEHLLKQFRSIRNINEKTSDAIIASLTSRETQILNYVANGNSNKQIAHILQISEQTIKNHVSNILRKLNANDRAHAVVLAIRYGWISAEELQPLTYSQN
ncbi:LuxR C-terminal-related transcriptional regulator [Chloroflexota bacterium]